MNSSVKRIPNLNRYMITIIYIYMEEGALYLLVVEKLSAFFINEKN